MNSAMDETQDINELHRTMREANLQSHLYKPTSFWKGAADTIANEIQLFGIQNFRSLKAPLAYFVPNYGSPTNSLSLEQIDKILNYASDDMKVSDKTRATLVQYLSGYFHALSDYRVLKASDQINKLPFLHEFSESNYGNPIEQYDFDGRKYSRSSLNYLLGLSLLKQNIETESIRNVLEIGGGFGTLGEILIKSGLPNVRYIDVDIPPVQYVAAKYLEHSVGCQNVKTFTENDVSEISIERLPSATVLCNWQIENLQGDVDLFVNFISFQEMEPDVVSNYLSHVDRLNTKWILLRNMREGKQKKTISSNGVEIPILSEDYLKMLCNYRLIARNVHPYGYETADGFNSELLLLERKSQVEN